MKPRLFKFLLSAYVNRTARKLWQGTLVVGQDGAEHILKAEDIDNLLSETWQSYLSLAPGLTAQPNLRTWLVMHFACLTLAAQQALLANRISQSASIDLITDFSWHVTSGTTRRANRVVRPVLRNQLRRMEFLVDLVMKLVFCKPAYQTEKGSLGDGFFMNVHTCPVAAYMLENQSADLCISAWCGVDFGLVEIIGGRLERSGTIAMGADFCDFKFYTK